MNQFERGARFRALHVAGSRTFLMPNAWDAGSAMVLAAAGFEALGTTSAGICFSLGQPDTESGVDRREMLERVASIAAALPELPLNADLQAGYGLDPGQVADTVRAAIAAGAVGANIEDATGQAAAPLFPLHEAVARIRSARLAADGSGIPFVLTARADAFLVGAEDAFAEAVKRCEAFMDAGADCLFVPGASDPATIAALVRAVPAPFNVVMGLSGSTLSVAQLANLGVRRISIGGSLARACLGFVQTAAAEMAQQGTFNYAKTQIPHDELSGFFARQRGA